MFLLLYVLALVVAVVAIILALSRLDATVVARSFRPAAPVRALGGSLMCIGTGLALVWIAMWAAHVFAGRPTPVDPETFKIVAARSARLFFYDALATAWRRAVAGEPFSLEHKADLRLASTWAVRTAARATDLMHRMGGTNGLYARSRLERHFRDAQTVRHHGFVSDSRLETVGQVYLGVQPEFPFVAF